MHMGFFASLHLGELCVKFFSSSRCGGNVRLPDTGKNPSAPHISSANPACPPGGRSVSLRSAPVSPVGVRAPALQLSRLHPARWLRAPPTACTDPVDSPRNRPVPALQVRLPLRQSPEARQLNATAAVARSTVGIRIFTGGEELFPHVALFGPLGRGFAGELQLFDVQLAVAVRADIFHLGPAQLQDVTPRARFDRHAETPQTRAAAITLIPDREVKEAERKLEPDARKECVEQIETELAHREVEKFRVRSPEEVQEPERKAGSESGCGKLQQQK